MKPENAGRPAAFSITQIGLHWCVAALVVWQLFVHEGIEHAFDRMMDEGQAGPLSVTAAIHIGVGGAVFALTVWRLWLRLRHGTPEAALPAPRMAILGGKLAHLALYGFLILLPLTGALAYFGQNDLAAEVHEFLQWLLVPLLIAHAVGAFIEHAIFRNSSLTRMLKLPDDALGREKSISNGASSE